MHRSTQGKQWSRRLSVSRLRGLPCKFGWTDQPPVCGGDSQEAIEQVVDVSADSLNSPSNYVQLYDITQLNCCQQNTSRSNRYHKQASAGARRNTCIWPNPALTGPGRAFIQIMATYGYKIFTVFKHKVLKCKPRTQPAPSMEGGSGDRREGIVCLLVWQQPERSTDWLCNPESV